MAALGDAFVLISAVLGFAALVILIAGVASPKEEVNGSQ